MAILIIIAVLVLLTGHFRLLPTVPSAERAQGSQPQITVEPTTYDFGNLVFGVIAEKNSKKKIYTGRFADYQNYNIM